MSAATIPWEQYQQLPPDQRRRPLTDAEYAALTKQQRIAAGLDDDEQGAPANFNGPVFPNPDHIQPRADTDPAIDPTRLPQGVSFQRGNWSGTPPMDISNPAAADVQPEMGREVGADFGDGKKMSAQPIDFSKYEQGAPPGGSIDFSKYEQPAAAAQSKPGMLDREIPLDSYTHATESGLQSIGRGTRDAVMGTLQMLDPRPKNQEEEAIVAADQKNRAALPVYRILRSLGHTAGDATQLAGAFHDINQSADPVGTYAKVAQETAGQGAGQALTALATEGAIKGAPAVASGVGKAAKATAGVIRDVATPENIATAAGGAVGGAIGHAVGSPFEGGTAGAVVGRAVGKAVAKRLTGAAEEAAPELDATAENKDFAGEPPSKPAKVLDATGENKPFAGGMDEYAPPKPKAPRTIVTDPSTGRPGFSDVVETKPQAAAPIETKAPPTETPAPQVAPQGTPAETPGPAADDLLERLKGVASRIQKQEAAEPGSADEDLVQQAQDSLDMVRARKAVGGPQPKTSAESLDEFNQRLSAIADRKAATAAGQAPGGASSGANSLNGIFNRLVKGEAGQAGLPGSVTNADEGIAEIQNRPVIAQRTQQVSARGYLGAVGADENSVLKTPRDQDSVFWHRQQIAQSGQPPDVELHVDEGNNVIGAQGRHRAIAAVQQGGPKAMVNVTVFKHPDPAPR